jgi:hypothetical protein
MDAREIIDAYLQGRIESWGVFRKLVRLGLSTATALAVAGALPAAVKANSATVLSEVTHDAQESPLLDLLMSHLASQLEKAMGDGSVRPLAATLARIGGANANLINCDLRNECLPLKLNFNDGINTNITGELVPDVKLRNLTLNLEGNIGPSNLSLNGIISPRDSASGGRNIGNVVMNVDGRVGEMPLNFHGTLGNLNTKNIPK